MANYLSPPLDSYFEEVAKISGRMMALAGILPGMHEEYTKTSPSTDCVISSSLIVYRDLTLKPATDNLEAPNFHYEVKLSNLKDEIDLWISSNCGQAIADTYETFEDYFITILTTYLFHNQDKLVELGMSDGSLQLLEPTIKDFVTRSKRTNNKGLIQLTSKLSPYFSTHESTNYFQVNILHWFDLLSAVRHTLIHSRQAISKELLAYLEKHKSNKSKDLFDRQFKRKSVSGDVRIFLTQNSASDVITWLNSFAHLIFKCLSTEAGLSTSVPRYIPEPLGSGWEPAADSTI